jgi:hypothetical protein
MNSERRRAACVVSLAVTLVACQAPREPAALSSSGAPPPTPPAAKNEVGSPEGAPSSMPLTTFASDVAFLSLFGSLKVLESPGGGRVAVSAQYQGRVMTSAVEPEGRSLGFINRKFIEERKTGTSFDNYGGEDRFWLGPEGGQYALYFAPGKPFVFTNWQTPHSLQEGAWETKDASTSSVTFLRRMEVTSYAGTTFTIGVERKVSLVSSDEAKERLGVALPSSVQWVGFASANTVTNLGKVAWTEQKGLVSVWILGMFAPVSGTRVIVPFEKGAANEIVNDRYFGKVPPDRLNVHANDGFVLFKCDGQYRSKIGLGPARAKPALGSYSDEAKLLTIVLYSKPAAATRYVNSMWEQQKDPYGGDVINSYNDGPTEPGKASLGGFYEIESSSPAAALGPGEKLTHVHQTFHFVGPREALDAIARKVLGVSLDQASAM